MPDFLTPFHYDYMLRAIWVSALVGGVCGFLSSFITLKGWSLMGDALSHAVVPGVALAHLLAGGLAHEVAAGAEQRVGQFQRVPVVHVVVRGAVNQ